mgnify:CR=1 FL=1
MITFPYLSEIIRKNDYRIIMVVVDGLGGIPSPTTGLSELESAKIPNVDQLAQSSDCGLSTPVLPGITPGSGPGHLSLFGYDPIQHIIGRGALEAFGAGVTIKQGEIAARGNFCTIDGTGLITDRRAGRISTTDCQRLCTVLSSITIPQISIQVVPGEGHRFTIVFRGKDLSPDISSNDPQAVDTHPLTLVGFNKSSNSMIQIVNRFLDEAKQLLCKEQHANMVLLRGFSSIPDIPSMATAYQLNPAAIAAYPMYRGLAQLIGMNVLPTGKTFQEEIQTLKDNYLDYDFFFLHYKDADTAGEDGDFKSKVKALEEFDRLIPELNALQPTVLAITGDHSTPSVMKGHSWHPVPFLIHSKYAIKGVTPTFSEKSCKSGSIGIIPAQHLMLSILAHADKLTKFGA